MNIRSFNYPNMISLFGNIESERLGFYFSFCLHLIFLIFVIGFPNFFVPPSINIPTIIPIEIINVTDTTSISKENVETDKQAKIEEKPKQKKFNNLQEERAKEIKIEEKPKQKKFNNLQEERAKEIKIEEKPKQKKFNNLQSELTQEIKSKAKPIIKSERVDLKEEKFESLPTKKIKPKIKPKPENIETTTQVTDITAKPRPKPSFDSTLKNINNIKPETEIKVKSKPQRTSSFNISSMLKDLRNDQTLMNKEKTERDLTKDKIINKNEGNESKAKLTISEIDLLIQQLSSCWSSPAGAVIKKGMVVKISAKIRPDRKVFYESVRIIDTNIPQSNPFYGPITESAMRTLLNPECIPLKLPADKYDLWKNLTINFDHSIMKGYQ